MIAKNIKLFIFLAILLGVVIGVVSIMGGRSPSKPVSISANIRDNYVAPIRYQDHRDQQKAFLLKTSLFETTSDVKAALKNTKITYTDHGKPLNQSEDVPQALILIHGVPTSSWMYRKIIPDLQKTTRVISIDLLGFGSSDKPNGGPEIYAAKQQAKYISALLSNLGINRYAVLMHDMGGLVAWELMRMEQEKLSHLVILNTIIHDHGFNNPEMDPGVFTRQLMKAYSSPLSNVAVMRKTFNDLGLVGKHELTEKECFGYVQPMREGSDPALYSLFTMINDDLFARLEENRTLFKGYKGKAMVMWGAKDETLTTEQIPIVQETLSIPPENIYIYPDNAHFLAEEIPETVVKNINKLFAQ